MTERYGSFTTDIEGPSSAGLKQFLYKLNDKCQTELKIIYEEKGFFRHDMTIKVSGYESQLNQFQNTVKEVMRRWQEDTFTSEHYKVKNVEIKELSDHTLMVDVKSHRFSGIKNLATNIYNHFDIKMEAEETKNLFSKYLTLKVTGDKKQLEQFKSVFLTYAHSKNLITMQSIDTEKQKNSTFKF